MADRVEKVQERTTVEDGAVTTRRAETTVDRDRGVGKLAQVVWFVTGVIVFILLLRLLLAAIGANPANAFADLIYSLSNPFVAPFRGLLQVGSLQLGVARFEFETAVAILIYALIGWGLVRLINLGRKDTV